MLAESDLETVRPRPRPSPRPKRSPSRSRSRSLSEAISSHIHDPLLAGGAQAFTSCGAIESVQLPRTLDKVHPWSEFKLFSLGAVHAYSLDTGDLSLANATFDNLLAHYSLTQFINSSSGLVVKEPQQGLPPGVPSQAADNAQFYFKVSSHEHHRALPSPHPYRGPSTARVSIYLHSAVALLLAADLFLPSSLLPPTRCTKTSSTTLIWRTLSTTTTPSLRVRTAALTSMSTPT